ncbi:MAG TPA: nitrate/sulfonate/bicarbonate ABC transporter ATP-binding protein [Anaerovibrio sp.]|uniref:ABC transporter ATP-binding protein n=1 Tax=Anaerovibrio lipolyticus TaxID=82374 RepID=UPI000E882EBF|nr:ABC transporter ATP-binding protein [Anaerovibrio lipolyticus]MBE6105953.1 ABC transporter ATP-binding protein [Anaerovibrio lipolyticus]HAF31451.1 nitrate/sulfonate/bicarbonate ABC transporter ATP-binding protein [Anaerovibrio sp.]HAQ55127.1 nitrate/sulfonate/bicarbonate ABC transporter ATP-binding protein [Anaerovibrio sp.]HCP95270.1 nitrate/sulfonate/bicarbonate ABC transporter ATP-binding protein [Anaerovibrio sp.]
MISIENLSVNYKSDSDVYTAISGINLTIPEGGTLAVIGPSGCGKSTLLKAVAGLIPEYEGTIKINGDELNPKKQTIGFMPQNYGLLPWRTVIDNIRLGMKIKRAPELLDRKVLKKLMRQLGIEGLGHRYPAELSGGQQQRVALARVFALQPDVLLMDEPFSALDAITREEMQDVFLKLWQKNNVSTIFVTHYVEEALYLGQRIAILSASSGNINRIVDNPLFGGKDIRQNPEFFEMSLKLKNSIKKDWNQAWEN